MKKQLLFITAAMAIILFGCGQPSGSSSAALPKQDTIRPAEEMVVVKTLRDADSVLKLQANDIGKRAIADSARAKVSNYLTNTINAKATNWIAYLAKVDVVGNTAFVQLSIPRYWRLADRIELASISSLILEMSLEPKDTTIMNMLKPLKEGDRVLVSGEFPKFGNKVDVQTSFLGFHNEPDAVVVYPQYDFNITDIKKYK